MVQDSPAVQASSRHCAAPLLRVPCTLSPIEQTVHRDQHVKFINCREQGRTKDFARGDAHFWLTYPLPPPDLDLDLDPDPHQDFELDPDPAYFTRTVLLSASSILEIKRLFFVFYI